MSKICIGVPVFDVTVTAGTASSSHPATNLDERLPSKRHRFTADAAQYIQADLGASIAWNAVGYLANNLTNAATFRLRADNSAANLTTTPAHDSGVNQTAIFDGPWDDETVITRNTLYFPTALVTAQHLRLDLDDPANPDGYIEGGRLFVSRMYQPTHDVDFTYGWAVRDLSVKKRTEGQDILVDRREKYRVLTVRLFGNSLNEIDQNLRPILRRAGKSREVLVILDPDEDDFRDDGVIYGLITNDPVVSRRTVGGNYEVEFEITEMVTGLGL